MSTPFGELFDSYLEQARTAQSENRHHDYRRSIFMDFLTRAFGIDSKEIDIEKYLRIDVRQKGWIDALFRDVIFEFKRDLGRERPEGKRELRDYLKTLERGTECVGLLTDGLIFEAYVLENGEIREPKDQIDLEKCEPDMAFMWLDSYLFSQKYAPPTSADIVQRFGAESPTFVVAGRVLHSLLERLESNSAVRVKREQWQRILAKVYGSDIGSDNLFVRHTFLNQFAKLLAYSALAGIPHDRSTVKQIITGEAFHRFGVSNIGEIDFFAWILDSDDVYSEAIEMLLRLAQSLAVYDLKRIDEDLLKQLYQNLVDPDTRHDVGEFYTPDWLAELTLREIEYRPSLSLLDPTCGSGTFLFLALRQLANKGLTGWNLIQFALENVVGMDVHPLAVTIARINYLLAIIPHMRGARTGGTMGLAPLPVYMADALQTPQRSGDHERTLIVPVDVNRDEKFHIPQDAALVPTIFSDVINQMDEYAKQPIEKINTGLATAFRELVKQRFSAAQRGIADLSLSYWSQNLRLLHNLIQDGRDSIWSYILKNSARPLLLSAQKFDIIVGNPPWLSYRFIKDKTYKKEVKDLYLSYELIDTGDVKLFAQIDLSTLVMVHCEATYLKPGGIIAFVMPRSVITGAKQHRLFQTRGITRVLDMKEIEPLFKVETVVILKQLGRTYVDNIPTTSYRGRLPEHQMSFSQAYPYITIENTETRFTGNREGEKSYYYDKFHQGATLVPRNLCFVKPEQKIDPGDFAFNPSMITDPDVNRDAKMPWKSMSIKGKIYEQNLFATLLSKNLMPFGYRRLHLVALPICLDKNVMLRPVDEYDFLAAGHGDSWRTWFSVAEQLWNENKKESSQFGSLIERYDYQRTLTSQHVVRGYKVLYNHSGTHLSSSVINTEIPIQVFEYPVQGFIADVKTYYFETENVLEAHYLCSILNTPSVDTAIKAYQTRGIYKGERDIHRTPFEACAIPAFDANNPDHQELARLSVEAHAIVAETAFTGQVVKARRTSRAAVESQIATIDVIARRLLGL